MTFGLFLFRQIRAGCAPNKTTSAYQSTFFFFKVGVKRNRGKILLSRDNIFMPTHFESYDKRFSVVYSQQLCLDDKTWNPLQAAAENVSFVGLCEYVLSHAIAQLVKHSELKTVCIDEQFFHIFSPRKFHQQA